MVSSAHGGGGGFFFWLLSSLLSEAKGESEKCGVVLDLEM